MIFDISKTPFDENNDPVKDEKGNLGTYRKAFMTALVADFGGDGQPIKGEEKFKRFDMYMRLKNQTSNITDLSAEDIVFLTTVCRDAFPILIAGQCRDFLKKPMPDESRPA